jgi:hypothetical protein
MADIPKSKLSPIRAVVGDPSPNVVSLLESLLADARAGEFHSLVAVYQGKDGSAHAWALEDTADGLLVFELELLKLKLVAGALQNCEED